MINIIQTTTPIGITDNVLKITNDSNEDMAYSFGNILENDDDYTFSCWMKSDTNTHTEIYISNNVKEFALTPEWTRIVFTSKFSSSSNKTVKFSVMAGAQIYAYEGQLEHGNKATDFRSNEKDITDSIQTVDEKLVVLQTDFSVEQGKIETLIKETTIDNDDGTKSSLKDKYLETVATVDGMKTTIGNIQTTQSSISSKVTEIEATTEGIKTNVSNVKNTADSAKSTAEQTATKFNWLVKSGTSSTDFTLTDRTAQLVADSINLHGLVTFKGLDSSTQNKINNKANQSIIDNWAKDSIVNGETVINGGYIKTNTIKTYQLAVDDIFATGSSVMNIINAQEINANRITSGQLFAERINAYGLSIVNKNTNQQTFSITNNGEVTIKGSVSSSNYNIGKTGWSINNDGTAEFNDIIARGSVITNDGGIVSSGGTGRNLIKNSNFTQGTSYWTAETGTLSIVSDSTYSNHLEFVLTSGTPRIYNNLYNVWKENKTYSYSFYAKASKSATLRPSRSLADYGKTHTVTTEWKRYTGTIYSTVTASYGTLSFTAGSLNVTYYIANVKLEEGNIATDWSPAPEDKTKQVRSWAGTSFEERESAPWIVYSDGSMKATQGEFSGVFSGIVDIGNIRIIDPSSASGGDALLTIQDGGSGLKRIQLTDSNSSIFAQDLIISNNTYSPMVTLKQDGTALFDRGINIGDSKDNSDNVILNKTSLIISNKELTTTSTGFLINSSLDVGSSNNIAHLTVHGDTISDSMSLAHELNFGGVVKFTTTSNGINIDFVE